MKFEPDSLNPLCVSSPSDASHALPCSTVYCWDGEWPLQIALQIPMLGPANGRLWLEAWWQVGEAMVFLPQATSPAVAETLLWPQLLQVGPRFLFLPSDGAIGSIIFTFSLSAAPSLRVVLASYSNLCAGLHRAPVELSALPSHCNQLPVLSAPSNFKYTEWSIF